jgi:hypothetical protein
MRGDLAMPKMSDNTELYYDDPFTLAYPEFGTTDDDPYVHESVNANHSPFEVHQ